MKTRVTSHTAFIVPMGDDTDPIIFNGSVVELNTYLEWLEAHNTDFMRPPRSEIVLTQIIGVDHG